MNSSFSLRNIFFLLILISGQLLASPVAEMAVIKGKVVNERNEPVEYATAVLLNPATGEVVKGEVCNATGEFTISRIEKGEYVLSVSMVGYKKVDTEKMVVDGKRTVFERTIVLNEHTELLNWLRGSKVCREKRWSVSKLSKIRRLATMRRATRVSSI